MIRATVAVTTSSRLSAPRLVESRMNAVRARTRTVVGLSIAALAVAVGVGVLTTEGARPASDLNVKPTKITDDELRVAADTRVFFGHQSVGANILSGVTRVFDAHGVPAPPIIETTQPQGDGGVIAHAYIGTNTDPTSKVQDFAAVVRAGVGASVDVAFMKFCFVDIRQDETVEEAFELYRATMAQLEAEYPGVTFIHVTEPLTTELSTWQRLKSGVKSLLGRGQTDAEQNAARGVFNELIRDEYASTGQLFDLAAIESRTPNGTPVGGVIDGRPYQELYPGYTTDGGHLNEAGSLLAAEEMLRIIAAQD
jgi:hypothetical protein